jgi:hypothetical protein
MLNHINKRSKRTVDLALLKTVRAQPCLVCRNYGESDPHHVKSKGSGGHDIPTNVVPLCRKHHTEIHAIGLNRFSEKYVEISLWLSRNGWAYNPNINKWKSGQYEE